MDEPVSARPPFLVRHTATALAVCFFLLAALLTRHGPVSWNDSSRMATIDSLVERHTFAIDGSSIQTGDKYRYNGKFYSDKPAMLAVVGAGVALGLNVVGISLAHTPRIAYCRSRYSSSASPMPSGWQRSTQRFGRCRLRRRGPRA
jgi:hypothetical protein